MQNTIQYSVCMMILLIALAGCAPTQGIGDQDAGLQPVGSQQAGPPAGRQRFDGQQGPGGFDDGAPDGGQRFGPSGDGRQRGGRGNFSSDMTEEQRQQMMAQRVQPMIDACQGKAEGEICTIQSQRGEMQGACGTQKGQFLCVMQKTSRDAGPAANDSGQD